MLTIEDIIHLCEDVLEVRLKKRCKMKGCKTWSGEFQFETSTIYIYTDTIKDERDYGITLLHEFIHARNYFILDIADDQEDEMEVEREAIETYEKQPGIVDLLNDIYNLKKLQF